MSSPESQDPEDARPPSLLRGLQGLPPGPRKEAVGRQGHKSTSRKGALQGAGRAAGSEDSPKQDTDGKPASAWTPHGSAAGRDQPGCDFTPKGTRARPPTATSAFTWGAGAGAGILRPVATPTPRLRRRGDFEEQV